MKLLMIRHAKAGEREDWLKENKNDDERPLTPEGIDEFTQVSKALQILVPSLDQIYTSPLKRSQQTAAILHKVFDQAEMFDTEIMLQDSTWKDFHTFLLKLEWNKDHVISVVGHENHLSHLLGNLISSNHVESIRFKKGGVAMVDLGLLEGKVSGKLVWFFPPKVAIKLLK